MKNIKKYLLKCPYCGHEWVYTGKCKPGEIVTCSNSNCWKHFTIDENTVLKIYNDRSQKLFEKYLRNNKKAEAGGSRRNNTSIPSENSIKNEIYKILLETKTASPDLEEKLEEFFQKVRMGEVAKIFARDLMGKTPTGNNTTRDKVTLYFRGQELKVPFEKVIPILSNPEARKYFGLESEHEEKLREEVREEENKILWTDPDTWLTVKVTPEAYAVLKAKSLRRDKSEDELVDWVDLRTGHPMKIPKSYVPMLTAMSVLKGSGATGETSHREGELQEKLNSLENSIRDQQVAKEVGERIAGKLRGGIQQIQEDIKELKRELADLREKHNKGSDIDNMIDTLAKFGKEIDGVTFGGVNPQAKGLEIEEKQLAGEYDLGKGGIAFKHNVRDTYTEKAAELVDYVFRRNIQRETPEPDVGPVEPPPEYS